VGVVPVGAPALFRRLRRWFSADSIGVGDADEGMVATDGVGLKVTDRASRGPGSGAEVEGRRGVVSDVVRAGIVAG
jgi:hypothetical protein